MAEEKENGPYCWIESRNPLSQGMFSSVYVLDSRRHGNRVVKLLDASVPTHQRDFEMEVQLLTNVCQGWPEFVDCHDAFRYCTPVDNNEQRQQQQQQRHYALVLSRLGPTLSDYMDSHSGVPSTHQIIEWMHSLLTGLQRLHAAGYVHADLKPDNLCLPAANETDRLVMIDLGLAHPIGSLTSRPLASVMYRCPERILNGPRQRIHGALDMWSVGCILAYLLTGGRRHLFGRPRPVGEHLDDEEEGFLVLEYMEEELGVPKDWPEYPGLHRALLAKRSRSRQQSPVISRSGIIAGLARKCSRMMESEGGDKRPPFVQLCDLLLRLLVWNPAKRITAADALVHPVFFPNGFFSSGPADNTKLLVTKTTNKIFVGNNKTLVWPTALTRLPSTVMALIFSMLDHHSHQCVSQVSRDWRAQASRPESWCRRFRFALLSDVKYVARNGGLKNARDIDLQFPGMSTPMDESWSQLVHLTHLRLHPEMESRLSQFTMPPKLTYFEAGSRTISTWWPASLVAIRYWHCSVYCDVSWVEGCPFRHCPNLRRVYLHRLNFWSTRPGDSKERAHHFFGNWATRKLQTLQFCSNSESAFFMTHDTFDWLLSPFLDQHCATLKDLRLPMFIFATSAAAPDSTSNKDLVQQTALFQTLVRLLQSKLRRLWLTCPRVKLDTHLVLIANLLQFHMRPGQTLMWIHPEQPRCQADYAHLKEASSVWCHACHAVKLLMGDLQDGKSGRQVVFQAFQNERQLVLANTNRRILGGRDNKSSIRVVWNHSHELCSFLFDTTPKVVVL